MKYFICFLLIALGLIYVKNKKITAMLLIMDVIFMGMNTGSADFINYYNTYYIADISFKSWSSGMSDYGLRVVYYILREGFHMDFHTSTFLLSVICFFFIYNTVKRYTNNTAAVMALFTIFPFFISAVQLRFFYATVIIIFSVRYLEDTEKEKKKKRTVLFCACVIFASLLHFSCIFYFSFLLLKLEKKDLMSIVLVSGIILQVFVAQFVRWIAFKFVRYESFVGNEFVDLKSQFLILLILFLNCFFVHFSKNKFIISIKKDNGGNINCVDYNRSMWFSEMATKLSVLMFLIFPIYSLVKESNRLLRACFILEYIFYVLPIRQGLKQNKYCFLVYIGGIVLALFLLWFYCIRGMYGETVFVPIIENNLIWKWM